MIAVPSLPAALDAGLRGQRDDWDESKLHISDLAVAIGEKCPRQLWLRLQGAEKKELSAGQLLMFDHGNRIHERLVEIIRQNLNNGWQIESVERRIELDGITGRYDTRLYNKDEGWEIIVDFKSQRGAAFGFLNKTNQAKPDHVLQVQGYITAADSDAGLVFYVDREGQNACRQFYVQRDDITVWRAAKILKSMAAEMINTTIMPPAILEPKLDIGDNQGPDSVKLEMPWQCQYCDYCGPSCPGALPPNMRNKGIMGYITKPDGVFVPYKPVKDESKRKLLCNKEEQAVIETLLEMQGYAPVPF